MPLYKEDVPTKCSHPGCNCGGEMYIHARCHPDAKLEVYYKSGVLYVRCWDCKTPVADFFIASRGN